jgi:hypothetical protein
VELRYAAKVECGVQVDTLESFEQYARASGAEVLIYSRPAEAATAIARITGGRVLCTSDVRDWWC